MNLIQSDYVDEVKKDSLIEKVIPKVLKELDPHTVYIPVKQMKGISEEMSGNFSGIGVQFSIQNDTIMVIDVISGGPSRQVGILAGDRIVKVNDTIVAGVGITNEMVMQKLRGPKGTKVNVSLARPGYDQLIDVQITRGDIPIYSVDVAYMMNDQTGYIKVSRFGERTYREFMEGIKKITNAGAQNMIIDLRGNPGGYLPEVIRMVNEFLAKDELIVYTEGKSRKRELYKANGMGSCLDKNVVVLIDDFSASASEIFAGAIQDNDRGFIVGRRSFGKGLVQEQIPFVDGSALRLTVARYYTPSGRSIQKPYNDGNNYREEIMRRYLHGEFEEADSIQFADSLKFYTREGRTVYGGGGIMPDYFVPNDTTGFSNYLEHVIARGLIYSFSFQYADSHREELNKLSDADAIEQYLSKEKVYLQFLAYVEKEGIPRNKKDLKISGKVIDTQVKAYIARNILGEEGFYPIIRKIDTTIDKALEVLEKQKEASSQI